MLRAVLAAACVLALTGPAAAQFSRTVKHTYNTDCSDLKLKTASGVPGPGKHKYTLAGTCRYLHIKIVNGDAHSPEETGRAFLTLGAVWDPKDNTFREQGKLEGGATGSVSSVFKCSSDPYLGNLACTMMAHSNGTPWWPLSKRPQQGRPIGQGHVNAALAAQLSSQSAAKAPPPPPPPPAPTKKKPPVLKSPAAAGSASVAHTTPGLGVIPKGGMQRGVDLFGGDYKGFALARPDPALCRNACSREAACRSWTFVRPGIKGPQAACFLKNTVPAARADSCCVSGVK